MKPNSTPLVSNRFPRLASVAAACAAVLVLAACAKENAKPATQVAAKVNKEEISVHQINFILQRQQNLKPEQTEAAGRQVLERLIDQEVALQRAQEAKIDRDPRVVQELEAARREIVARAYLARIGDAVERPNPQEIKAYYDAKPALFSARRIYTLQEIQVEADRAQVAELQAQMSKAKSMKEVGAYLKDKKLPARATQNTTPAENLPLPLLDRFAALKEGQSVLIAAPAGARLITVVQAKDAPVGEEQARPAIEQFLVNEKKRKAVEQDLKTSRAAAHVEYVGQFAQPAASAAAAAPVAPAPVLASPVAATTPSGADARALDKGLAGLK